MRVNGIVNVNKLAGRTSFSVVSVVRRLTGEKHVGHAGTLDPMATGVLPVCLGQATRITEYIHELPKEYVADIELGTTTDTFDLEGSVTSRQDPASVTLKSLEDCLPKFQGTIEQSPPAYSALKLKGRRSYELVRDGEPVTHPPRRVNIHLIELVSFELPYLRIKVRCSKGTYIRSLANDLGRMLGCGAYLKGLVRTAYGPFTLERSLTVDEIKEALSAGCIDPLLHPPDYPLEQWDRLPVTEDQRLEIIRGHDLSFDLTTSVVGRLRAYTPAGTFLAIMKFVPETLLWHPEKVFDL